MLWSFGVSRCYEWSAWNVRFRGECPRGTETFGALGCGAHDRSLLSFDVDTHAPVEIGPPDFHSCQLYRMSEMAQKQHDRIAAA
jgi:hypothetical protein